MLVIQSMSIIHVHEMHAMIHMHICAVLAGISGAVSVSMESNASGALGAQTSSNYRIVPKISITFMS
jgi:hypothetical protein